MKTVCKTSDVYEKLKSKQYTSKSQGSDYGYACPDAIQMKGLVCHPNCVDHIV